MRGHVSDYVTWVSVQSIIGKIPYSDLPRRGPIDPNAIYKGCNFVQKTKPRLLQLSQKLLKRRPNAAQTPHQPTLLLPSIL